MGGAGAADPKVGFGAQPLSELHDVRSGLRACAEDADREPDRRRIENIRSLDDFLDRQMRTEDPHSPARRRHRQSGDLQAEPVELVGQGGEHDRAARARSLERRPQRAKMVLENLGEEVLMADLELASSPAIADLPEKRVDPLAKKTSDAEQRGVAGQGGRERIAIKPPAGLEGGIDDPGSNARRYTRVEGAAGAEEVFEIGLCAVERRLQPDNRNAAPY